MPKLRPLQPRKIVRVLKRHGFVNRGGKGSHDNWEHPVTNYNTTVSMHGKEIPVDTLKHIIRQSRIPRSEFEGE